MADNVNTSQSRHAVVAVVLTLAFGLPATVRAGHRTMLHADESHSGRTIELSVGDTLELSLAENPTTGYRWVLRPIARAAPIDAAPPEPASESANQPASRACRLVRDEYAASQSGTAGTAGRGGIHHWRFEAVEPGVCDIELEYRRAWETSKRPERTFRIQLEVRKGARGKRPAKPSE